VGEAHQWGIPEGNGVRTATEVQDQFPEPPDDGFPRLCGRRVLEGDFRLGVSGGDPFENGFLI
jgi:hypothetical protein